MTWSLVQQLVALTWCAAIPAVLVVGAVVERVRKIPRIEYSTMKMVEPDEEPTTRARRNEMN